MKLDTAGTGAGLPAEGDLKKAAAAWEKLMGGGGMTGWLELPRRMKDSEADISAAAAEIMDSSRALVVIGIGGSYLGARAAAEALDAQGAELIYVGKDMSPRTYRDAARQLEDKDFSVAVISKSGTTVESAIALRVFRQLLDKKYGPSAGKRIYAVTDPEKGALRRMARENGWKSFPIPPDVGGRYSVLSAVGLLPMAAAGIDIHSVLDGARDAMEEYSDGNPENPVWQYAAVRNALYSAGKKTELFSAYEPSLGYFLEWLKQLFGESEGKEGKGIFPASAVFTTDLHSMGQYIQQGERNLMQTVIYAEDVLCDMEIPYDEEDADGLNYLTGKKLSWVRRKAFEGTLQAHVAGGVPVNVIEVPELCGEELGRLFCFFQLACGLSGHMLGVDPFNQPGVEEYKSRMFSLLGRPGYV
ncbi:MAG: glucose-6-phosphate isomerase [Oscillospiraceae bacterium]|nr:glucose-6-phosphate isomerase [Oscillospiraceae bacterium]